MSHDVMTHTRDDVDVKYVFLRPILEPRNQNQNPEPETRNQNHSFTFNYNLLILFLHINQLLKTFT